MLQHVFDAEGGEDRHEDHQVIHRQALLEHITCEVEIRPVFTEPYSQVAVEQQGESDPENGPARSVTNGNLCRFAVGEQV